MKPAISARDAGVYVHFPWCLRLCPYCDFNVHVGPHDGRAYADVVLRELELRGEAYAPKSGGFRSIYFGGGTPSLWDPAEIARVISAVRDRHGLAKNAEITVEANPESLPDPMLDGLARAGVTRISIGAQSFLAPELLRLGRLHRPEDGASAAARARAAGMRISIDLILALPDQKKDAVLASIDRVIALRPEHVSAYALTIEPKTHFARLVEQKKLAVLEDEIQVELIDLASARLGEAGYRRYEVSSWSLPGEEAVHNSLYWVGAPYLGLGAGAHSYLPAPDLRSARRRENLRDPAAYAADLAGASFEEVLDAHQTLGERLIVGFRTRYGVDLAALGLEAGVELVSSLSQALAALAAEGMVEGDRHLWRTTERGLMFADGIARRLLGSIPEY